MGEIVRIMTTDGFVMASAITGTDIVARAQEIHHTSPTATAALGRSLLACSMMGNQLKGADNSLTLQIRGDGPLGGITCVSDSEGNVRGYVNNPAADVPRKQEGKLDVGGAVGSGSLTVIKDLAARLPRISPPILPRASRSPTPARWAYWCGKTAVRSSPQAATSFSSCPAPVRT